MAATVETIRNVIEHRIGQDRMSALREKFGYAEVEWALDSAGSFHAGCEEIGSSDAYYMARSFLSQLGAHGTFGPDMTLWDIVQLLLDS